MINLYRILQSADEVDAVRDAFAAAYRGPSLDELASGPVLNAWRISHDNFVMFLAGVVEGHPQFGSATVTTSPLIALSADVSWARIISRFYTVGRFLNSDRKLSPAGLGPYALPMLQISDARPLLAFTEAQFRREFD